MYKRQDLTGVQFVNGTRPGNPQLVELAKRQVGNVGGYPYWSWYGFDSRVESVSYTHLDVYKRQTPERAGDGRPPTRSTIRNWEKS